MRYHKRL